MATFYAWSDLLFGGETEMRNRADGRSYRVVLSRKRIPRGEKVTKKDISVSDEEWDALVAGGSIRSYPLPEEANDFVSPTQAIINRLYNEGEVDQDTLLELSLAHPPAMNPPADEGAELPKGA